MKLVLINYEYPPLGGGAGNATAELARSFVQAGHEVTVLTSGFGSQVGTECMGDLQIIRLRSLRRSVDRSSTREMFSYVWHAWRALPALLRRIQPDGLIVFFTLPCGPLGWYAHKRGATPYIVSLRGGDVPGLVPQIAFMQMLLSPIRRVVLRSALAVVANSRGLADLSQRSDRVRVDVIPNGVDTDFFRPPGPSATIHPELRVLFVGRFHDQKNLFVLLKQFAAAVQACERPITLTMVGDGPQREALETYSRSFPERAVVEFRGWLDKPALRDMYRSADIFVNPSLYEGMPNTVLEAMASGLPVIASDIPGNNELIRSNETGLLFDLATPEQLRIYLQQLSGDAELRRRLGAQARRRVAAHYSWSATAKQYSELFSAQRNSL